MAISKLILNGEVQMDVTSDTVEANKLLSGETATKNDGTKVTGTYIPPDPVISSLTIAPTESQQTFNEASISGYKPVTIGAIASDYIGSAIPMRSSEDVYFNGSQARVPSGYYSNNASQYISTVSATAWVSFESSTGTISGGVSVYSPGYLDGGKQTMSDVPILSAKTITPTESVQYISSYRWLTGPQTIAAISSEYIGSAVPKKSSTDLTANGSTVTAPAGYYSTAATKNISGGSAIPPAVTITKAPTFTMNSATGIVTASYSGSSTVTPTVTAGYISQGTAGTISTSGTSTYQLTSKAAATIYPSTADQTISSYRWLTGTQTVKSVTTSNLTAANIKSGVVVRVGDATNSSRITQITGTYSAPTPTISALTVTPTTTTQTFNATGVSGYKPVTVNAIPSSYIIPTGTSAITSNGTFDIASYASASVNVVPNISSLTVTPTESEQVFSGDTQLVSFNNRIGNGTTIDTTWAVNGKTYHIVGQVNANDGVQTKLADFDEYLVWENGFSLTVSGVGTITFTDNRVTNSVLYSYNVWIFTISEEVDGYKPVIVGAIPSSGGGDENAFIMRSFSSTVYENSTLTKIGPGAFAAATTLSAVSVPNVTEIGDFAFLNANLNISSYSSAFNFSSVTSIGKGAFLFGVQTNAGLYTGGYISDRMFPELTTIGPYAFAGTAVIPSLSKVTSVGVGAFIRAGGTGTMSLLTEIPMYCFMDASITTVYSSSYPNVESIGSYAFVTADFDLTFNRSYGVSVRFHSVLTNQLLSNIHFPKVKTIGYAAFCSCESLNIIDFPMCETISSHAFRNCYRLSSVIFPECTTIGDYGFDSCYYISTISFPKCVSMGAYAFRSCTSLLTADFPECTYIDFSAFNLCTSLTTANFPKCEVISSNAFNSCKSLTTISFPECTYINYGAFGYCSKITEAIFPKCSMLSNSVFAYCSSLSVASFPLCESVGSFDFAYCNKLSNIYFPECVRIGPNAFIQCSSLTNADFPKCVSVQTSAFYYCKSLLTASFPECASIYAEAFGGCSSLTTIFFPKCVSIGASAFANCSTLTTAVFPNCTTISSYGFRFCYSLSMVSLPKVTSIGQAAFAYCSNLFWVDLTGVTSVPYINGTGVFSYTPISMSSSGVYGSIYVPASLYNDFIVAQNWDSYSARIVSV